MWKSQSIFSSVIQQQSLMMIVLCCLPGGIDMLWGHLTIYSDAVLPYDVTGDKRVACEQEIERENLPVWVYVCDSQHMLFNLDPQALW